LPSKIDIKLWTHLLQWILFSYVYMYTISHLPTVVATAGRSRTNPVQDGLL